MKKYSKTQLFQGIGTAASVYGAVEGIGAVLGGGTVTVLGSIAVTTTGGLILLGVSAAFIGFVCLKGEKDHE